MRRRGPCSPGKRERRQQDVAHERVGVALLEHCHEHGRRQAVEAGEPRAVHDSYAADRDLLLGQDLADDSRPGERRPLVGELRPQMLEQHLRGEVVALPVHEAKDVQERQGGRGREWERAVRGLPDDRPPRDRDPGCEQRLAEELRRGLCRVPARPAAVPTPVGGQRRERRRLVDEEPRLPSRSRSLRVEERLVAHQPSGDACDAVSAYLRG